MDDNEKTPLEVIIENASFVKTEVIKVMMQVSLTMRTYDTDIAQVDEALSRDLEEEAIQELQHIKDGLIERKAKYLSEVVMCQVQLKEAARLINEQLHRQVPTEKRVSLLIDFDQLVKDCSENTE